MGQDFYNCEVCGEIYGDYGHYGTCGGCEAGLCGHCYDEMREKYGELGADHEKADWYGEDAAKCCDKCTGEHIDPNEFLRFVIAKTGLTEDALEEEFREMKRGGID